MKSRSLPFYSLVHTHADIHTHTQIIHTHQSMARIVSVMSWFGCCRVLGMRVRWDLAPVQPVRVYWVHRTLAADLLRETTRDCWWVMTWSQDVCRKYPDPQSHSKFLWKTILLNIILCFKLKPFLDIFLDILLVLHSNETKKNISNINHTNTLHYVSH